MDDMTTMFLRSNGFHPKLREPDTLTRQQLTAGGGLVDLAVRAATTDEITTTASKRGDTEPYRQEDWYHCHLTSGRGATTRVYNQDELLTLVAQFLQA